MSATITREEAVALCTALGFKTAGKWNKDRMLRKLLDLGGMVKDGGIQVDEEHENADRFNELLLAISEADGEVEFSGKEAVGEKTQEVKAKKEKAKPAAKKEEPVVEEDDEDDEEEQDDEDDEEEQPKARPKAAPKKKGDVERDRFTNKVGSQAAAINAVLGKKGLTYGQICEKSGFKAARVKAHIKFLVDKGFVTIENDKVSVV